MRGAMAGPVKLASRFLSMRLRKAREREGAAMTPVCMVLGVGGTKSPRTSGNRAVLPLQFATAV
jgi:hypothetical protein